MNKKNVNIYAVAVSCLEPEYLDYSLLFLRKNIQKGNIFILNNGKTKKQKEIISKKIKKYGANDLKPPNTHGNVTNIIWAMKNVAKRYPHDLILKIDEDVIWPKIDFDFTKLKKSQVYIPNITINNYTTKFYLENFKNLPNDIKSISNNWNSFNGWVWHECEKNKKLAEFMYLQKYSNYKKAINYSKRKPSIINYTNCEWPLMKKRGVSSMAIVMWSSVIIKLFNNKIGVEEILIAEEVRKGNLNYFINWKDFVVHINYSCIRTWVKKNYRKVVKPFLKKVK